MIRRMRLAGGLLYIEQGDSFRIVTTLPVDEAVRKAYRRMTAEYNTFLDTPEYLPDGEYYYAHGQMYRQHAIAA